MKNETAELEEKAKKIVTEKSTKELVYMYEFIDGDASVEVCAVRGWIMDELEARNESAFVTWLESNESSPRRAYL